MAHILNAVESVINFSISTETTLFATNNDNNKMRPTTNKFSFYQFIRALENKKLPRNEKQLKEHRFL